MYVFFNYIYSYILKLWHFGEQVKTMTTKSESSKTKMRICKSFVDLLTIYNNTRILTKKLELSMTILQNLS